MIGIPLTVGLTNLFTVLRKVLLPAFPKMEVNPFLPSFVTVDLAAVPPYLSTASLPNFLTAAFLPNL